MARLPYLDSSNVPEEYRDSVNPTNPFISTTGDDEAESPWDDVRHTHRILANNPPLLAAYRRYAADLWTATGLTTRQRELAILGVARGLDSAYEWHQHVIIALDDILTPGEILAVSRRAYEKLDEPDAALVAYAVGFAERDVDDETYMAFADHFEDHAILGTSLLLAYYAGIDYMGEALRLDLEEEFVGWELENVS